MIIRLALPLGPLDDVVPLVLTSSRRFSVEVARDTDPDCSISPLVVDAMSSRDELNPSSFDKVSRSES